MSERGSGDHPAAIRIRLATVEDAAAVSELIVGLARFFLADPARPEAAAAFFATVTPEALAARLAGEDFRYHVAEAAGKVVACVGVRGESHLYHLFVAEEHHGRGLGSQLWAVARKEILATPGERCITVNAALASVGFYRRLGFVAEGAKVEQDGLIFVPMAWSGSEA